MLCTPWLAADAISFRNAQFKNAFIAGAIFGAADLRRTNLHQAIFQLTELPEPLQSLITARDQVDQTPFSPLNWRSWWRTPRQVPPTPMFRAGAQLPNGVVNPSQPNQVAPTQSWYQTLSTMYTSVTTNIYAWLSSSHDDTDTQHIPIYVILDKYNLSTSANLQTILNPNYNSADFLSRYLQLASLKLDQAVYIQELLDDPSINIIQKLREHHLLFLQLNELGLNQPNHVKQLLQTSEASTLAKIYIEAGLKKSIESCEQRNSENKLRMAIFFQSKLDEGAPLKTLLKNATAALQQKSGYLAAKSYTVAQPYFEKARVLLGITDRVWQTVSSIDYMMKVNENYLSQRSLYDEQLATTSASNRIRASAPPFQYPASGQSNPGGATAPLPYFGQHTHHTRGATPAYPEAPPPPYSEAHLYPRHPSSNSNNDYARNATPLYPYLQQHTTNHYPNDQIQPSAPPYEGEEAGINHHEGGACGYG
ncbi:pentapeptide repeat-containing protein [Piscirickettsia salmonis]|uniref:pentapeptide repeat-containing protein n=1 Tax=Piscirickettsia salmonis TaxID=1238 RepID=UPI0007C8F747|nr:hypothetical protein A0O36_01875 [Piscirickettsiaceae bacterium NZ-RLO1]